MNPTHAHSRAHSHEASSHAGPHTHGRLLHAARAYDLVVWLFLRGREPAFRRRILELAHITAGESVLDIGCGTGTLAILAQKQLGAAGDVHGVDASAEMVARAQAKARREGLGVAFAQAIVEALPFPDARFDVVLSSLMLHHLPADARAQCAREVRRVLKPGGRFVVIDFGPPKEAKNGLLARFHRHGGIDPTEVARVVEDAGLRIERRGPFGLADIDFVIARAP